MKKLLTIAISILFCFNLMTDDITFRCHKDYTFEMLESYYEDGEGLEEIKGSTIYGKTSIEDYFAVNGKKLDTDSYQVKTNYENDKYVVSIFYENSPFSIDREYHFKINSEGYDFLGMLTVYSKNGFAGKRKLEKMLCLITQD